MNPKEIFDRQGEILRRAMPHLVRIDWPAYGGRFVLRDENGNLKYQAMMRRCYPRGEPSTLLTITIGSFPDREKPFGVLGNKLDALVQNPDARTSMGLRDPPRVWGGAIRTLNGISGITGLPETGDHLVETHLAWYTDQLTEDDYQGMTFGAHECQVAARHLVGMTLYNWRYLSLRINDIILAAVM
jgi:hypothetical protein